LVLLALLALYLVTLAPSVYPGDPAELVTAAVTLGVCHPTGYPLYLLLAKMATVVFAWLEPVTVVNGLSTLFLIVALGLLVDVQRRLDIPPVVVAASLALLGTTPPLWNAATTAEVYTLHTLLLVVVLKLVVMGGGHPRLVHVFATFGVAGFALGNHMMSLLLLPGLVLWLGWLWRSCRVPRTASTVLAVLGCYLLGASIIAVIFVLDRPSALNYIDQYAIEFPAPVFGDPIGRIWWLLSGAQYGAGSGMLESMVSLTYLPRLVSIVGKLGASNPPLILLGGLGLVVAGFRKRPPEAQRAAVLVLVAVLIASLCYLATYTEYFEPVFFGHGYVACAIGLSFLVTRFVRMPRVRAVVAAGLILAACVTVGLHIVAIDKGGTEFYQRETEALLREVEDTAVLFATWRNASLLWYELWVHGSRTDVTVVNALPTNWLRIADRFRGRPMYFESVPPGAPGGLFVPQRHFFRFSPPPPRQ